jgi:hypothetical protein
MSLPTQTLWIPCKPGSPLSLCRKSMQLIRVATLSTLTGVTTGCSTRPTAGSTTYPIAKTTPGGKSQTHGTPSRGTILAEAVGTTRSGGIRPRIHAPQANISRVVIATNALLGVLPALRSTNATTAKLALKTWRVTISATASQSALLGLTGRLCS